MFSCLQKANMKTCAFGLPKAVFCQIANAKPEFVYLRKNMVAVQPFLRAPREAPEGKSGRGNVCLFANANKQTCDFGLPKSIFIGSFFAARQRMNIKKQTARACRRHSVSVWRRREQKICFVRSHTLILRGKPRAERIAFLCYFLAFPKK